MNLTCTHNNSCIHIEKVMMVVIHNPKSRRMCGIGWCQYQATRLDVCKQGFERPGSLHLLQIVAGGRGDFKM
jgi:hypothetical protein